MEYPNALCFRVDKIFGDQDIQITLYSGFTTLVGTNASGKTQTLKALRDKLKISVGEKRLDTCLQIELEKWNSIAQKLTNMTILWIIFR